jgi:hypothetical protein
MRSGKKKSQMQNGKITRLFFVYLDLLCFKRGHGL